MKYQQKIHQSSSFLRATYIYEITTCKNNRRVDFAIIGVPFDTAGFRLGVVLDLVHNQ